MVRNHLFPPLMKPCICKRCGGRFTGGRKANFCEKCYLPNGRNSKKLLEEKKPTIICEKCNKKINKKNFWKHKHSTYKMKGGRK